MAENRKVVDEIKVLPVGEKFSVVGVVLDIREKKDKNGKSYWTMSLMDRSGAMDAKVWGNSQWWDYREGVRSQLDDPSSSSLVTNLKGTTVGVTGQVSEFRGKNQYNFNQVFLVDQKREEYRPESFVQTAPVAVDDLEVRFDALVNRCSGPVGDFLRFVFAKDGEIWDRYRVMPAAVAHHHAYVHGLLEHSISVTELALSMAQAIHGFRAPDVSLVIAGALLHDLGKLDSYILNPGPSMTVQGTVIDHVALGYVRFESLAQSFGLDEVLRTALGHVILSHHGHKEYGSPVLPGTPEALVVSAADELDFKLFCWGDAVSQLRGGFEAIEDAISDIHYPTQRRYWKWRPDPEE